jgi:hypothetical protein
MNFAILKRYAAFIQSKIFSHFNNRKKIFFIKIMFKKFFSTNSCRKP